MSCPVLLGIGSPVIAALVERLAAVPGLAQAVDLHVAPASSTATAPDILARTGIVLAEPGALDPIDRLSLPPGWALITLPRIEFASLWPLMAEHPPRDSLPTIPAPFGDRVALDVLQSGTPQALRRAAYDAAMPAALADLDAVHARVARKLFDRETGCDIRIAAFVLTRFRQERLFHSALHPAAPLLAFLLAQLLGHPAIAALGEGNYDARLHAALAGLEDVYATQQAPVHSAVAAHFGLAWWSAELRYRQGGAERSFAEWIDWQLRPPAPLPPSIGPDLAALHEAGALAQVAELHAAAEIARTSPFFATPVDPAIAPQSGALLSPQAGRYTLPPCRIALLADATVLGASGTVLHNGTILADTLSDPILPAAPAQQRIAERAVLAYGPGWQADPHGIATLLPRLVAAARLRRQHPALRVLLPAAAQAPWLHEMLALLGLTDATTWLPEAPVACDDLAVTSRFGLADISPLARHAAQALAALVPLARPGPRLLYLRCATSAAPLRNEAELTAMLAARGFTLIDTDHTPLAQRIALLRHATAVIAPQGGPLAELVFCPPGATVLELLGPADLSPLYWSLASLSGLHYGYVVGDPAAEGFTVSPAMLEQATAHLAPV